MTLVARNTDKVMVASVVDLAEPEFGESLERGGRICVCTFGSNLVTVTVKMLLHLI
jgi:hypothetical protein